jgi:hypothetical protein
MIVQRSTHVAAKPGNRDEMVEILQALWKLGPHPTPTHRIYVPITGRMDVVHVEIEFEDLEARAKFFAAAFSMPEAAPYLERWDELRGSGTTDELLRLVE